jgi:glycosyltransferase involved in cell wall biosynthesis
VLASGRTACDWPTLFNAARGATWPLTIVCSAEERRTVDVLNRDGRATVLSEITPEEHRRLLASAEVYALALRERRASSGQVRLARAIEAGVPVVATRVQGLDGYLDAGTTALAVPVGDAAALRTAIDRLLDDAPLRDALRRKARAAVQHHTLDAYVARLRRFVFGRQEHGLRVAFCGPIGAVGKPAAGGYESANRRNCDALARRGVAVTELPYPKVTTRPFMKLLRYGASFLQAAAFVIVRRRHYDLLHLTPLNMHFALAESWLVACARWMGKPVLLDIRAGTFVRHYEGGSAHYRRTIDRSLRLASQVAVEGEAYLPFVRERSLAPVLHFPNYVDGPALRQTPAVRPLERGAPIRLLYFGRIVAEKGIETALSALVVLLARGHAVELELIGDGPAAYVAALRQRHATLPVTWSAGLPVAAILQRAATAHFFIFASRHDGEGHSNALNEAMSVGLVPVCSDQGFTRSVVGDAGVVLPVAAPPSEYAAAIDDILLSHRWSVLSQRARQRVRTLYSEEATLPALIESYRLLQADTRRGSA